MNFRCLVDPYGAGSVNSNADAAKIMFSTTNSIVNSVQQSGSDSMSIAMQGPLSSDETRLINGLAAVNTAPIISYAASAPSLSSKFDYPWFFRMGISDARKMQAFADLMKMYGWTHASLLTTSDFFGTSAAATFSSLLSPGALNVYYYDHADFASIGTNITSSGLKVIFFLSSPNIYAPVLDCLTAHINCSFPGADLTFENGFVWIFGDSFPFYTPSPTGPNNPQFCTAVNGSIVFQSYYSDMWAGAYNNTQPVNTIRYPLKQIWNDAVRLYQSTAMNGGGGGPYPVAYPDHFWTQEYVPYLIDSFYAIAYAYKSLRVNNWKPLGCGLKQALLTNVTFDGFSGPVNFTTTQDRVVSSFRLFTPSATPETCSDVGPSRTMAPIGIWTYSDLTAQSSFDQFPAPAAWHNVPPKDGYITPTEPPSVSPYSGIAVALLVSIGITTPTVFVLVKYRKARPIVTAPAVHLIFILAGVDLVASSLIPITFVKPSIASCVMQFVLAVLGYNFIIAALGVKALIYELLSRRGKDRNILSLLNNKTVTIYTSVASLPAIIISVAVLAIDPPTPVASLDNGYIEYHCTTKHYTGMAIALVWLAILSIMALILAWRNRRTTISSDSRFIIFAVGNVLLMAIIGVVLGIVLENTASGVIIVAFFIAIVFGSLGTWGLTAGPRLFKLYTLYKSGRSWVTNNPTTVKETHTDTVTEFTPSASSTYTPPPKSYRQPSYHYYDDDYSDDMSEAYPSSDEGEELDWRHTQQHDGHQHLQEPLLDANQDDTVSNRDSM